MNATTEVLEELRRVMAERDEARRARDQYLRERDLALRAEERWRESLEALEEAIDDCLPGDDDDAPIDCVGRAGDKLRDMTRQRDEARAEATRRLDELNMVQSHLTLALNERDEARAEVEHAYREGGALYEAKIAEREAFRSGAEAMREACAQWFREHDESFERTVDACHDVIADMPIPEEP